MPISSRSVMQSTFVFLVIGLVALLSIVATTFWLGERAQGYFNLAVEARDTRGAAVDLRNSMQTAEASQRGFLLTGNEIYLSPYDTAKTEGQRKLATLRQLLAPYPEAAVPVQRLTSLLADKFDELDQTITLKRARHDDEALAIMRTNKGKAISDEANVFFSGIVKFADDRLTAGVEEQRTNAGLLRLVSAIGGLVIIAVVGGAAFVLLRYTRELRMTRDEVNALNAELEQRVSERTVDLVASRDRAQVLLSEVNHRVANSLALVSSLVGLQSKAISDKAAKDALAETQDRIFAISLVHKRLYSSNDVRVVTLDEYLKGLLDHLQTSMRGDGQSTVLRYDLAPVQLGTDASINLGVVVTEWVTNAFKYAYPVGTAGEIRVRLRALPEGRAELVVEDDGVGRAEGAPAKGTGLGSRIVSAMAQGLGGTIAYEPRTPGTLARAIFAVSGAEDVPQ
ncbi:MAG: CHASE3 domain-containing protein [Devosia sp.]